MKLNINFRKIIGNKALIEHINHRISFAFSRTKHAIKSTSLTVSDINGPKGGIDKACTIVIQPNGLKEIVISEQHSKLNKAIDRCIARANQTLIRQLKRQQKLSRKSINLQPA